MNFAKLFFPKPTRQTYVHGHGTEGYIHTAHAWEPETKFERLVAVLAAGFPFFLFLAPATVFLMAARSGEPVGMPVLWDGTILN